MTIPFQAEGQLLPVSPWLKSQLAEMVKPATHQSGAADGTYLSL